MRQIQPVTLILLLRPTDLIDLNIILTSSQFRRTKATVSSDFLNKIFPSPIALSILLLSKIIDVMDSVDIALSARVLLIQLSN